MELKQTVNLQVTIQDKTCTFSMPLDVSFGVAIDAAHQIYKELIDMARKAAEKEAPNKEKDNAQE